MAPFSEEYKQHIIETLTKRKVKTHCPMCDSTSWSVAEGYFVNILNEDPNTINFAGGPAIPTIVLVCRQCGFISQHAMKTLNIKREGS